MGPKTKIETRLLILGLLPLFLIWLIWRKNFRRRAYCARFDSLDTNGDGYISAKEFRKGWSTTHLKWKDVGSEKPSAGTEIKNELLAAALQKKVEFKKEEWDEFDLADLSVDSYIKAGNHYFKPAENIGYIGKVINGLNCESKPEMRDAHCLRRTRQ